MAPTDLERRISKILTGLTGIENPSTTQTFFYLNMDSIKIAQLMILLNEEFEIELVIDEMFDNPNICSLAKVIKQKEN